MRRLSLLLCFAVGSVCATELPSEALERISAGALKAHVAFLASDALEGRGTPSRGQEAAAEYIAAQFMRLGLEPAGGGGSYFQNANFALVKANLDGAEVAIEAEGKTYAIPAEHITVVGAQARGAKLDGMEAVKVTTVEEATPARIENKVVLVEAPDYNALRGAEARRNAYRSFLELRDRIDGARAAVVIVIGETTLPGPAQASRRLVSMEEPQALWLSAGDADLLKAFREGQAFKATVHVAEPEREPVRLRNVAGLVRGTDPKLRDTYVIVSAHYDHMGLLPGDADDRIMNGANDNASGTASMIEVANALVAAPPRRSVLFIAWFGEELGLFGSRHYVSKPLEPLAKTIANVNLEQMGRIDDPAGPAHGSAGMTGADYSGVGDAFARAAEEMGVRFVRNPQWDEYFARSDNVSFAARGIPAHTMSVALEFPDYHKVSDEWHKLDYANMEKITRFVAEGVARLANSEQAPEWNANNPNAAAFAGAR
ncbi:MAG: M28 family peptidase [bacterium]